MSASKEFSKLNMIELPHQKKGISSGLRGARPLYSGYVIYSFFEGSPISLHYQLLPWLGRSAFSRNGCSWLDSVMGSPKKGEARNNWDDWNILVHYKMCSSKNRNSIPFFHSVVRIVQSTRATFFLLAAHSVCWRAEQCQWPRHVCLLKNIKLSRKIVLSWGQSFL